MQANAPTARDLAMALADRIEILAQHLLGEPNRAFSTRHDWRYGNKGSFSIIVAAGDKRGSCYDHEKREGGDALWLVQRCNGGSVREAMDWAVQWLGGRIEQRPPPARTRAPVARKAAADKDNTERALALWDQCFEIKGTLVETYLRSRRAWPSFILSDLRFHPQCPMGQGRVPAMVGLMRNVLTNKPQGIHRTALLLDGSGRDKSIGKKMLGPAAGAAIMLTPYEEISIGLGIAEGIENAATMAANGWAPVWSALDAGGMLLFPVMDGIEHLNIFADADDQGTGIHAARVCADRWSRENRGATIHTPPAGMDWNRIAMEAAA